MGENAVYYCTKYSVTGNLPCKDQCEEEIPMAFVELTKKDNIAVITMNRPEALNALS